MGAVFFSIEMELVHSLRRVLPLDVFFETGTFRGDTSAAAAAEFSTVITVELAEGLHAAAVERFRSVPNVTPRQGTSPDILKELAPQLAKQSVVYWLDAHWCGATTGGQDNECPLIPELEAIRKLNDSSVILIDDARLFLAPPPLPHDASHWPRLDEVVRQLAKLSKNHGLWVVNDVLVFAPLAASDTIIDHSRRHGVEFYGLGAAQQLAPPQPPLVVPAFSSLNSSFQAMQRSERLFVHHMAKLGIDRVLDIGANTGQFAQTLRKMGFAGTIYSVEPQRCAYIDLLSSARSDVRWLPLPRQAAGAEPQFLELNLAENSWSSSFRPVHDNHLRAEWSTRTIGHERVHVNRSGNLLRPEYMAGIEALKIDVQGFEDQVLDGYAPLLGNIRVLMIELSMVECYEGGPDMFDLDRRLVNDLGFSRITLEPSYYDENTGIVQQYDGIYYRPEPRTTPVKPIEPPRLGAVVTSFGGPLKRVRADGGDLSEAWQHSCINSWKNFGVRVVSVAEVPPPDTIDWSQTAERPSINQILNACPLAEGEHLLVVNADIDLAPDFHQLLPRLDGETFYYGQRLDVQADPKLQFIIQGGYAWGFDYFILPKSFISLLTDEKLLPDAFRIGEPWWDYALPVIALAYGFAVKRLPESAGALHHIHDVNYSADLWCSNGEKFQQLIRRLQAEGNGYATTLLEELAESGEDLEAISRSVCLAIP